MASIKDQERLLNSLIHQNDLEMSDETLEYLRDPTTPEAAKLDALIDLMTNTLRSVEETNQRLDTQHQEQVEHQQKVEVWHEEESRLGKRNFRIALATLLTAIVTVLVTIALSEEGQVLLLKVLHL